MSDEGSGKGSGIERARADIRDIFESALDGADAGRLIRSRISLDEGGLRVGERLFPLDAHPRIRLFGIGKVAAHIALALEDILGDRITGGLVIVKDGYGESLERIEVREAGHPIPDVRGMTAARELVGMLRDRDDSDLILFIVSGGGSSLFVLPAGGIGLREKIETNRILLRCGAPIEEVNAIRKAISAVKGGQLIPIIHPATLVNIILSDVIGDPLSDIASGPTVLPDRPGFDPMAVIERYGLVHEIPESVLDHLRTGGSTGSESHAVTGGIETKIHNVLIGNNRSLLAFAGRRAEELGYETRIVESNLEGEARIEADRLSRTVIDWKRERQTDAPPLCLLIGGETTVTVRGTGTGGRCTEFALAAAISLEGEEIVSLAAGSDGTDGPTEAAGAVIDGGTCRKGREIGLDPRGALDENDSYPFFRSIGDLVVTGPTKTNVNDLYAFIIP